MTFDEKVSSGDVKITCKLTIIMTFEEQVWSCVRGPCDDAERGEQLELDQDLPRFQGQKYQCQKQQYQ